MEVEGLTQIYHLLPPHIITRHACDNEAAVRAHKTIFYHAQKSTRKWARTDYRTALDRLHQAIQNRGSRIQVVHTHSHLEDTPTDDVDLQTRRNTLAAADTQADLAHTLPAMRLDASPREMFRVHNAYGPLEKNVGAATVSTLHLRCTNQLQKLKMEGRMIRTVESAVKLSTRCTLPTFLLSFRTKLILNRLPTRQERSRRGDTHADGSPVDPQCPHCPTEIETHEHALIHCPHHAANRLQLLYKVNSDIRATTSTLYKQGMQDAGRLSELLDHTVAPTFLLTEGWQTRYTDKHGRKIVTGKGPPRVTNTEGTRSLHPSLFVARARTSPVSHTQSLQIFKSTPRDTLDIHMLRLIMKHIPTQQLLSNVVGHPSCRNSLDIGQVGLQTQPVHESKLCIWEAHTRELNLLPHAVDAIDTHLTYSLAPLLIFSRDKQIVGMRHIHTVEESGLQVDTGAFWKGKRKGSTASTTSHKVYVHLSHGCPQRVSEIITLSIRVRHPTKFTPRPEDLTHLNIDKLAETPRSIADCIIGRANTVECLAIQAGFITQEQMLSITQNGTPRRLTTKLATTLQRTC